MATIVHQEGKQARYSLDLCPVDHKPSLPLNRHQARINENIQVPGELIGRKTKPGSDVTGRKSGFASLHQQAKSQKSRLLRERR